MNNLDVSGLLRTYAEKCAKVKKADDLKEMIRDLKRELNSEEIKKMRIIGS